MFSIGDLSMEQRSIECFYRRPHIHPAAIQNHQCCNFSYLNERLMASLHKVQKDTYLSALLLKTIIKTFHFKKHFYIVVAFTFHPRTRNLRWVREKCVPLCFLKNVGSIYAFYWRTFGKIPRGEFFDGRLFLQFLSSAQFCLSLKT